MTLIASDGYEYEDLTQRLLGNPLENHRNASIRGARRFYPGAEAEAFAKAYDKARGPHSDKYAAGWSALDRKRKLHPSYYGPVHPTR